MPRLRAPAILATLVLLAACGGDGGGGPTTIATVGGTGTTQRVTVVFDKLGVPHVRAASDGDAAYAYGYVQARARLWEMDVFRRQARGKLAELSDLLSDQDAYFRTVFTAAAPVTRGDGTTSWRIEDAIVADLRAKQRTDMLEVAQRFADGVNRYLDDLKAGRNGATLPPQYAPFSIGPGDIAPWTIEDTFAIGRLQTWDLSSSLQDELVAGQLAATVGAGDPALFVDLTRHAQAVPSVILPDQAPQATTALRVAGAAAARPANAAALAAFLPNLEGGVAVSARVESGEHELRPGNVGGSNNWVVAPAKSATGHALVANDPHLTLYSPPIFHLVHLTTPTRDVAGVAFPGTPIVVIGHNGKVGWGETVTGYDVTDLYTETLSGLDGASPTAARGAGSVPVHVVNEEVKLRSGGTRIVPVFVVEGHGPIAPGTLVSTGGGAATGISMRWTGQAPTQEPAALLDLNAAGDAIQGAQALKGFAVGAQNFVLADTGGRIGYQPHALVPLRPLDPTNPPWLPLPSDGAHEWTGFVADADAAGDGPKLPWVDPSAPPPARGYVATANNDVVGTLQDGDPLAGNGTWPYLQAFSDPGYRHARVVERLEEKDALTLDDMTAIQADDVSLLGKRVAPWIVSQLQGRAGLSANAQAAVALLAGWAGQGYGTPTGLAGTSADAPESADAAQRTTSAAAAVFHAWYTEFASVLLDDELGRYQVAGRSLSAADVPGEQLARIVSELAGPSPAPAPPLATGTALCDDVTTADTTETCADAIATALDRALAAVGTKLGAPDPGAWRWGRLHQVRFRNPLEDLYAQVFGMAGRFSIGPLPNDGGLYTVDVANFPVHTGSSFTQGSGPSVRFSAELDPAGVRWRAVIPGGEDERNDDPHRQDQLEAWLSNQPGDQPFTTAQVDAVAQGRIVFDP